MDAFALLRLPRDLSFDEAQVREAYRTVSKETQDEAEQAAVTAAYQTLRSPSARLRHWLEISGREGSVRGTIDGELLDWFGGVGATLQSADELLRRREQCQTALAKAMMEGELHAGRARIEEWQARLQEALRQKMAWFPAMVAGEISAEDAWTCVRDLGFIEKWQHQLRERYGKFFF
jgi:hypothetical protein